MSHFTKQLSDSVLKTERQRMINLFAELDVMLQTETGHLL